MEAKDNRRMGETMMTDEERKMVCTKLRRKYHDGDWVADEIERLARENAQMRDMLLQYVAATADRIEAADTGTIQ